RGHHIVEVVEVACPAHPLGFVEVRPGRELGEALALEAEQEVAGIDAVEAASERFRAGSQVLRRRNAGGGGHQAGGLVAALAEPLEERVRAERYTGDEYRRRARAGDEPAHDPVDLVAVARMVGAGREIRFA